MDAFTLLAWPINGVGLGMVGATELLDVLDDDVKQKSLSLFVIKFM
jgi:hypothetical protein